MIVELLRMFVWVSKYSTLCLNQRDTSVCLQCNGFDHTLEIIEILVRERFFCWILQRYCGVTQTHFKLVDKLFMLPVNGSGTTDNAAEDNQ